MRFVIFVIFAGFLSLDVNAQEGQGCFFNNHVMADAASVVAYQNSTVPFGSQCVSETRTCSNGVLSGSFNYGSCRIDAPVSCLFNGQTIANGQTVITYPKSSVPYGQNCVPEVETCNNGLLSGDNQFASCVVQASPPPVFVPSTKAEKLAYIAFLSCGIHNKSFPKSFCSVQPSLDQILTKVQACTAVAYPDTSLSSAAEFTLEQLLDPHHSSMREKFFSGLWYQPSATDDFETYFGVYSPDILSVLCYGANSKEVLEGFDPTTEYSHACSGGGEGSSCWYWQHDQAAQARWNAVQAIRSQLRKCLN